MFSDLFMMESNTTHKLQIDSNYSTVPASEPAIGIFLLLFYSNRIHFNDKPKIYRQKIGQ